MYIFSIMLYQLTISISRIQYGASYILEPYVKTCQLLIWCQTLANEKTYIIIELECKLFPPLCIPLSEPFESRDLPCMFLWWSYVYLDYYVEQIIRYVCFHTGKQFKKWRNCHNDLLLCNQLKNLKTSLVWYSFNVPLQSSCFCVNQKSGLSTITGHNLINIEPYRKKDWKT